MALAIDATSSSAASEDMGAGFTISHTCSGSQRYLIVMLHVFNAGGTGWPSEPMQTVTYNGVDMVRLVTSGGFSNPEIVEIFGLANPASGTHNISLQSKFSGVGNAAAISFTGAWDVQPDSVAENNDSRTVDMVSITCSPTTIQAGEYTVGCFLTVYDHARSAEAITSGTSIAAGLQCGAESGGNGRMTYGYLTSASSGAGSQTFTGTWTGQINHGIESGWYAIIAAVTVYPFPAPASSTNFLLASY